MAESVPQFQGRQLILTRIVWFLALILTVSLFASGMVISYFDYLGGDVPDIVMARLTLPTDEFINHPLFRAIEFTAPVVYFIVGVLLFWRLGKFKMAWLTSLVMITSVPSTSAPILSLGNLYPRWYPFMAGLQAVGFTLFVIYFYVFPDGRFRPTWTKAAGLLMLPFALAFLFSRQSNPFATQSVLPIAILSGFLLLGLVAQVYRYLRLSSSLERQQTKWVVLGFVIVIVGIILIVVPRGLFASFAFSGAIGTLYDFILIPIVFLLQLAVPVTILLAVTRYRLWDVDIIIRKTLQYAVLSGSLVLIYVVSVILLQAIFDSLLGEQTPAAIVISTLITVALFAPLRGRVQEAIDRRFFRKKYDAQQVLAQFALTARDETDIEALFFELAVVVQETMQPENVSIWLKR